MAEKKPTSEFPIPDRDVPLLLSRIVTLQLRTLPPFTRFGDEFWDRLKALPNLTDFIESASYEIASRDPILREEVAGALAGLVVLFAETQADSKMEQEWRQIISDPEITAVGESSVGDEAAIPATLQLDDQS